VIGYCGAACDKGALPIRAIILDALDPHFAPSERAGLMATPRRREGSLGLWLVAADKLLRGFVLLAVGVGALRLLHKDLALEVMRWANIFRVDPNNRYIHRLLARSLTIDARKLREFSVGTFLYSALSLTEGTGLMLRKRWAAYLTIISTGAFLPLEVYEVIRVPNWQRITVLVINVAVVIYLAIEVRRNGAR
jgi:uncharacterized membrane protein (DUF2068 family)